MYLAHKSLTHARIVTLNANATSTNRRHPAHKTSGRPQLTRRRVSICVAFLMGLATGTAAETSRTFNVRDYGASGLKADDAQTAIQKTVDACAASGGGTVLFPPGDYTSGTIHLRSHIRIEIAKGATVYASTNPAAYYFKTISVQAAVFFGDEVEDITFEGAGTIDGQAAYDWREDDFEGSFPHKESMIKLGKPLLRTFPQGFPKRTLFPRLVWLGRSRDVRFRGLRWVHSPSWTINLYDCERVTFDGLYIYSSLQEGVWADGIDLDGCRDISISNCRIETGDDCIVFISTDVWGPIRSCENIRVTKCVLSSASAAVKFSEGNWNGIRNISITDSVLTNVNRGFVFSTTQGGDISDVVISNLVIDCSRFPWFWAGDGQPFYFRITRLSEFNKEPAKPGERPPGTIRNITIRDVVARAKGTSRVFGHKEAWLKNISMENVQFTLSADRTAPFDYANHVLDLRRAEGVTLKDIAIGWQSPALPAWENALHAEDVRSLAITGFEAANAPSRRTSVMSLQRVQQATLSSAKADPGTDVFLEIAGADTRDVTVSKNDFTRARTPVLIQTNVPSDQVRLRDNSFPAAPSPKE